MTSSTRLYSTRLSNGKIARLVEALLPIEAAELDPRTHLRLVEQMPRP
jgi:hypothetical protein